LFQSERTASLKRVPILANLSDTALRQVAEKCRWSQYQAGEQIVSYQDPSTSVHFLVSGKARAVVYSLEGKAVIFVDLLPASMFGEIAAIDRGARSASIEALEPCTVAALSADQFDDLMVREPAVAIATLRHLAADVRRLSERVFEFSTLAVQNRIQAELLRLAREVQQKDNAAVLSPAPSLSEIANRVSTHREAVSREISRLAAVGLLKREASNLWITDLRKLAELVVESKGE
jgi:CRP-like cAMP-binding protein